MHIVELKRQIYEEIFRLTALNKTKSRDMHCINGKTSFIFKEM